LFGGKSSADFPLLEHVKPLKDGERSLVSMRSSIGRAPGREIESGAKVGRTHHDPCLLAGGGPEFHTSTSWVWPTGPINHWSWPQGAIDVHLQKCGIEVGYTNDVSGAGGAKSSRAKSRPSLTALGVAAWVCDLPGRINTLGPQMLDKVYK